MNFLFKRIKLVILIFTLNVITISVSAHVLKETNAQVILRDGQVEVRVTTDIEHFTAALQSNLLWLMGDIDEVMPTNLDTEQQQTFIKKALQQKTLLTVNKKAISFERVTLVHDNDSNTDQIIFQAKHQFANVSALSLSFHKSLGLIHINVVKPQYKLLEAGGRAVFHY